MKFRSFARWLNWLGTTEGKIILVGLGLRVFLAPFFFHPDLKTILYMSGFLSQGIVNIYDFLATHPDKAILGPFYYPPLAYFSFGGLVLILRPLLGGEFMSWLAQGNEAVATGLIFRYQLLTKLPLIAVELATVWLVASWFGDEKKRRLALVLGIFNPITFYATVAMGQFDILPAFLTVAAVSLARKSKWGWGAVMLGLAAGFKTYPLLLLPFMAVAASERWGYRLKMLFVGAGVYGLTVLPFVFSAAFGESVFASGLAQRIFFAGVDLGFERRVLVVVAGWIILFLAVNKGGVESLLKYIVAVLALVLGFSHFHPQWGAWIGPFLVWVWVARPVLRGSVAVWVVAFFGIIALFSDKFLGLGLMSPVDPGIYFLPAVVAAIGEGNAKLAGDLCQSVLVGSGFFMSWQLLKEKE